MKGKIGTRAHSRGRHALGAAMIIAVVAVGQASGQMLQQKDLAFPQVAAGPEFQSVICVTNRGGATYSGLAHFWRGQGQEWNPRVNGVRVLGSRLQLMIGPGRTEVLRIDDDALAAGAVAILAQDPSQDNFIEGNLTYSRLGADYDSVGVAPAVELYRSATPFDDFRTVGLALANPDPSRRASVKLRLLDENGAELETVTRDFPGRSHQAQFLNEIFTAEGLTGKVEIASDAPILATAVTFADGEISALPLEASPIPYTVRFRSQERTDEAEAAFWAEGRFVQGYIRFLSTNGDPYDQPATYLFTGTLTDGVLRLVQIGAGPQSGVSETLNILRVPNFSFEQRKFTGSYTRVFPFLSFPFTRLLGTYELVRRD